MSAVSSDLSLGRETSSRMSATVVKESVTSCETRNQGLLSALCQKLFCWRNFREDEDTGELCRVRDTGLCLLCCGTIPPRHSERHRTVLADSKQVSVHWVPSGGVETTTRQPGRHREPKCSCATANVAANDNRESSSTSRACGQSEVGHHGGTTLRRSSPRTSDSLVRGKPSAAVRRVMLADAAYGHATVLDECTMSDSDAWSGSLSLSRPDSGTNSLERVVVHENAAAEEMYESYSDEGEPDDDVAWAPVIQLPALPVYDQVKESTAGWSLGSELRRLVHYGWYWGPITRVEAEEKLAGQEDGTFLVRDSSDDHYLLSLSFRSYGRTLHTRIEHCQGSFSLYSQSGSDGYESIVELIERSIDDSRTGVFCYSRARALGSPSFPVRLTRPVSRFAQVRTLQYLCRFLIRQHTRVDHIQKLPLPTSIRGWLEERPY